MARVFAQLLVRGFEFTGEPLRLVAGDQRLLADDREDDREGERRDVVQAGFEHRAPAKVEAPNGYADEEKIETNQHGAALAEVEDRLADHRQDDDAEKPPQGTEENQRRQQRALENEIEVEGPETLPLQKPATQRAHEGIDRTESKGDDDHHFAVVVAAVDEIAAEARQDHDREGKGAVA